MICTHSWAVLTFNCWFTFTCRFDFCTISLCFN